MLRLYDENNRDIMNKLSSSDYCSNSSCLGEPQCSWCSAMAVIATGGGCGNDGNFSLSDTSSQLE